MDEAEGTTVPVSSAGQVTIPKEFRDKLQVETPGRIHFIETADGEVVIRPVKRPAEIRGMLASSEADEQRATEELRTERLRDEVELAEALDEGE